MWIKFPQRAAAIFFLIALLVGHVAAQDARDASTSDTVLMQYYTLFRRLVHPPPRNRPPTEPADQNTPSNRPQIDQRALLHRSLKLSDTNERVLDQIAEDCIGKTDKLDQQAMEIITARRAEVRAGKVSPTAPPPNELHDLQAQRDDAIRNAIEQLRAQLGEAEFKRVTDSFSRNSATSSMQLPLPNQKPLMIDVRITAPNRSDDASLMKFGAREKFTVEVAMLNKSTEMISIKTSELYGWLDFNTPGQPEVIGQVSPRGIFLMATRAAHADETTMIELPPNELRVVTQIIFGPGAISLPPGQYQLAVHPRVVLSRPPKSDFLQLSLASPFAFEITQ